MGVAITPALRWSTPGQCHVPQGGDADIPGEGAVVALCVCEVH